MDNDKQPTENTPKDERTGMSRLGNRVGRGNKIPDVMWDEFIKLVADGLSNNDALRKLSIGRQTFRDKKLKDPAFAEALMEAYADFKITHIGNIARQAKTNWTASAWLLERKFPDEFGAAAKLDLTSGGRSLNPPSWFNHQIDTEAEDTDFEEIPPNQLEEHTEDPGDE